MSLVGLRWCLWAVLVAALLEAGVVRAQAPADDDEVPKTTPRAARAMETKSTVEEAATNAVYLELVGPGLLYSFNYEHRFGRIAARAGFGYFRFSDGSLLSTPLSLTVLVGGNSPYSAFEIGAGAAIVRISSSSDVLGLHNGFVLPMVILGGRRQSRDGRLLLRGGFSPIIGSLFLPLPYLAAGLTF